MPIVFPTLWPIMQKTLKYLGASRQKLDDRGRFHMPARWADQVVGELMLTAGPNGSLLLLEKADWEDTAERIGGDPLCAPSRRRLRSLFVGHAEVVSADKNNRILIAEALRHYADLQNSNAVYLVGNGHSIEIWAQSKWEEEATVAKTEQQLFDLPDAPGHSTGAATDAIHSN